MQLKDTASTAPKASSAADQTTRRQQMKDSKAPTEVESQTRPDIDFDAEELEKVVESLREFAGWGNFDIGFDRNEEINSVVITIVDRESGEVIKQIPPEEILRVKSQMREILGLVFDHLA